MLTGSPRHRRAVSTSALGLLVLAAGCASAVAAGAAPVVQAAPAVEAAAVPAPAPVYVTLDGTIRAVTPDGAMRDTGLPAGDWCSATSGIGGPGPLLSPDHLWVAWMDGDVWVAEIATGERHRVTRLREDPELAESFCIELSDWSPDSRTLLYHVGERQCEDCDAAPARLQKGFFLLAIEGFAVQHLPALRTFGRWLPDSRSLLAVQTVNLDEMTEEERRTSDGRANELLYRVTLPGDARTLLQRTRDTYAFSQIAVRGTELVFGQEGKRIVRAPLDDLAHPQVLVEAPFADCQWPAVSPDGALLAHSRGETLEVRPFGGSEATKPYPSLGAAREFAWYDAKRLLVCRADGLFLVDAGTAAATRLAGEGACFVRTSPRP